MTQFISIFIFIILLSSVESTAQKPITTIDLSSEIVVPKQYIVTKVSEPIVIDGVGNENSWTQALFTDSFIDIEGVTTPKYDTKVKMLWDANYLYVYAQIEEPHIWGNLKQRDTVIYYNNDFEVFLSPSGTTRNYAEIEINSLGTVWDLLLDKPYRDKGKANNYWNLDRLKSAVHIYGTLNHHHDIDSMWTVEMAIPMDRLLALKRGKSLLPAEGEQWRLNFSRVEWEFDIVNETYQRKKGKDGKFLPEYNWVWSNQNTINMHEPEKWGSIQFTHENSSRNIPFIHDEHAVIKQVAYALFRQTKFGKLKELLKEENHSTQTIRVKYSDEDSLISTFYKTNFGFEYQIATADSDHVFIINETGVLKEIKEDLSQKFTFATWAQAGKTFEKEVWEQRFESYIELGISEVLVGGDPDVISQIVPLANENEIKIHAWMWTLNRPNDTICIQHPEWYAVNKLGQNSLEKRAYVDYYQWLSPFHPEAREYVKSNVRKLAKIKGLASIHLDYVRYPDVILGADLQPKYDLVQNHEMPEYDYGYHPIARQGFQDLFGVDPIDFEHPELSTEWRQYRLNAVTDLVNELVEIAHTNNHKMTAAVFPFPEMSRQMVRQAWNDWNLDAAYPMLYHNFYRQNIEWIGFATRQGVRDVDFPIFAGLFIGAFENPAEFESAIRLTKKMGAAGISLFTADHLDEDQKNVLIKLKRDFSMQ